jgi:hypothetical protein
MNQIIIDLYEQASEIASADEFATRSYRDRVLETFAELIVKECAELNRHQSQELMGVIADVEQGDGFDDVCLNTVKRVADCLAKDLKEHFGVAE